jgi:pimeloyl-CoA synthetase
MSSIVNLEEWQNERKHAQNSNELLFLTGEQIRSSPDFKDASDEEIQNIINTLHNLALLTYRIISKELNQQMLEKQAA